MSIVGIVCLSAIIGAFALFAAVLAWGDHQTRHTSHPIRSEHKRQAATDAGFAALRDAAEEASEPVHAA
jgi:hypothetical protein